MDVFEPDYDSLVNLFKQGNFLNQLDIINQYNADNYSRFDVFDETHPFYQRPKTHFKSLDKTVANIFQYIPCGNGSVFFAYSKDDTIRLSVEMCIRALLTSVCFSSVGGSGYSPNLNGSAPYYTIYKGRNLFETLVLNIYPHEIAMNSGSTKVPVWRDDRDYSDETVAKVKTVSTIEGLTFLVRSVCLIPIENPPSDQVCTFSGKKSKYYINSIGYAPARKFEGIWTDPYCAYLNDVKQGIKPLRPSLGRVIWRDLGPLLLYKDVQYGKNITINKPLIVDHINRLIQENVISHDELNFQVFALEAEPGQSKFYGYSVAELNIPKALLPNKIAWELIQKAMDFAESTEYYIKDGVKEISNSNGLADDAKLKFWTLLEPDFKSKYLIQISSLPSNTTPDQAHQIYLEFCETIILPLGKNVLDMYIDDFDTDSKLRKKQVEVRDKLAGSLYLKLHPESKTKKKTAKSKKTSNTAKQTENLEEQQQTQQTPPTPQSTDAVMEKKKRPENRKSREQQKEIGIEKNSKNLNLIPQNIPISNQNS